LALTTQGEEIQGTANVDTKGKPRTTSRVHATTAARTHAAVSNTRMRPNMAGTRVRAHTVTPRTNVNTSLQNRQRFNELVTARNSRAINRERNLTANRNRNATANQNQNVMTNRNRDSSADAAAFPRHGSH